jgi:hypothetical protein
LKWLLVAEIAVSVVSGVASVYRRGLLDRVREGNPPTFDEMQNADNFVGATAALWSLVSIAILVVLIVFLWRAAKNTELWQRDRAKWRPGWAIGAWFIPFANLVLPAMVVQDVWRRSPEIDPWGYRHAGSSPLVGWWWATWIVSSLFVRLAAGWGGDPATAAELSTADTIRTIGLVASIAAAVFLVGVVRRLAARQAILARSGPTTAPTPTTAAPGPWTPPA